MHIVHYIHHLREEEGGVVRSVLDLTRALAAHGDRVTIITTDPGGAPPEPIDAECGPHVELMELPRPLVGRLAPEVRERVRSLIADADVVHLHTIWDPHNLPFAATARRLNVPYVVSTHGMLDDPAFAVKRRKKQLYLRFAGNRLLRRAALLHVTATGERRQVEARLPDVRTEVVPLVFDVAPYRELPGPELARSKFDCLKHEGPKLLFLSRVHPIKGPEIAIQAAARLAEKHDLQLVMAGPGDPKLVAELQSLAERLGIAARVTFIGMVSGDVKFSLYQACDVFVLPTQQENFGMVFPEALACGLPVVATDTVDTAAELADARARLVPRTVEAFVAAIDELLTNSAERQQIAKQGRERVFEWLNVDRVVEQYRAMYQSAFGE